MSRDVRSGARMLPSRTSAEARGRPSTRVGRRSRGRDDRCSARPPRHRPRRPESRPGDVRACRRVRESANRSGRCGTSITRRDAERGSAVHGAWDERRTRRERAGRNVPIAIVWRTSSVGRAIVLADRIGLGLVDTVAVGLAERRDRGRRADADSRSSDRRANAPGYTRRHSAADPESHSACNRRADTQGNAAGDSKADAEGDAEAHVEAGKGQESAAVPGRERRPARSQQGRRVRSAVREGPYQRPERRDGRRLPARARVRGDLPSQPVPARTASLIPADPREKRERAAPGGIGTARLSATCPSDRRRVRNGRTHTIMLAAESSGITHKT
jgi:hypothetical protein